MCVIRIIASVTFAASHDRFANELDRYSRE